MPFLSSFKFFLRKFDFFKSSSLLRYRDEPEYQTLTGGLISMLLLLLFISIFTNTVVDTINRVNITSTRTFQEETDPSYLTTAQTPLLFAIGIIGLDLNNSPRLFDVIMRQNHLFRSNYTKYSTFISLVPCQRSMWSNLKGNLSDTYDRLGLSQWLCAPSDVIFNFQGKYSSQIFQYIKITVTQCNNSTNFINKCASPSIISSTFSNLSSYNFNFFFINTILNQQNPQYKNYYLQDRNYFPFSPSSGSSIELYFSSYRIQTDSSILPFSSFHTQEGGIVYQPIRQFTISNPINYISLYLRKSSLSLHITRSFTHFDQIMSYIGGLFSAILTIVFIFSIYNEHAYEMEMASRLYSHHSVIYNPFTFVQVAVYGVIGWGNNHVKKIHSLKEETAKQLDINLMMKRIQFLESCMDVILDQHQIIGIHLRNKPSIDECGRNRKMHSLVHRVKKRIRKEQWNATEEIINCQENQISNECIGKNNEMQKNIVEEDIQSDDSYYSDEEEQNTIEKVKQCLYKLKLSLKQREKKILASIDPKIKNMKTKRLKTISNVIKIQQKITEQDQLNKEEIDNSQL